MEAIALLVLVVVLIMWWGEFLKWDDRRRQRPLREALGRAHEGQEQAKRAPARPKQVPVPEPVDFDEEYRAELDRLRYAQEGE